MPIYRFGDMVIDPQKYPWGYDMFPADWPNTALSLGLTSQYIESPIYPQLNNFTLFVRFKANSVHEGILLDSGWWNGTQNVFVYLRNTGRIDIGIRDGGTVAQIATASSIYAIDTWYNLTVLANGIYLKCYIGTTEVASGSANINKFSAQSVRFGLRRDSAIAPFDGLIAGAQFYKEAVSLSGIDALANNQLSSSGDLRVFWPLNEGEGAVAQDLSGHGNDGTIYNPVWTVV